VRGTRITAAAGSPDSRGAGAGAAAAVIHASTGSAPIVFGSSPPPAIPIRGAAPAGSTRTASRASSLPPGAPTRNAYVPGATHAGTTSRTRYTSPDAPSGRTSETRNGNRCCTGSASGTPSPINAADHGRNARSCCTPGGGVNADGTLTRATSSPPPFTTATNPERG
jgi:hypothetical protein